MSEKDETALRTGSDGGDGSDGSDDVSQVG
jgi:hypothetical protein